MAQADHLRGPAAVSFFFFFFEKRIFVHLQLQLAVFCLHILR